MTRSVSCIFTNEWHFETVAGAEKIKGADIFKVELWKERSKEHCAEHSSSKQPKRASAYSYTYR